ncbi:MAG: hypothetical protein E6G10_14055 [Actinobacteria bacterium]|nr:MAG: hypothetical protein E6G10_14055 [Actinomycetota bacterium]
MLAGCAVLCASAVVPGAAAAAVAVKRGASYGSRIFPDNAFTKADRSQVTGRRVNFRQGVDYPLVDGVVKKACTDADYSICDAFAELNKLDGFDLQPRVVVPFTGAIKLDSVNDSDFFITTDSGSFASGLRQLTFDPATNTLAGISDTFLREDTTYRIHVTRGIRDSAGKRVDACGEACVVRFTTRTASGELVRIRRAMDLPLSDPNNAYALAGFPGASTSTDSRKLSFTQNGTDDVFLAATVAPSLADPLNGITRTDQVKADPNAPGAFTSSAVPNLIPPGGPGYYAFGSFLSPRYQYASSTGHQDDPQGLTDGEIPPVPTTQTPRPLGADRIGVIAVTPDPTRFPPPWPAAIYGPGFTRSDYDLFVTADYNASLGIVTLATDPAGHGFGPQSTTTVTSNGTPTTFLSYGRGRDRDGDGAIGDGLNDGVGPTGHVQSDGSELPSRKPLDGLESGLVQTVVDNMALGRALKAGLDIPGVGTNLVDPAKIMYYGLSFGGIYGTMLMGTDPLFHRGLLNVPGGPIVDIARLSGFRGDLAATLRRSRPNVLNGGPGLDGFTEDLPLRNDPRRQQLVRAHRQPRDLRPADPPAARSRLGRRPQGRRLPDGVRRRHGAQPDGRDALPRGRALRPRRLLPQRQDAHLRLRPARLARRSEPGRPHVGRAAARDVPVDRRARQHQPGVARGADRRPQQPRVPALPRSADGAAADAPAVPGQRRLPAAAVTSLIGAPTRGGHVHPNGGCRRRRAALTMGS